MFQPKYTRIGVDVGATGVRAVQLLRQRDSFIVRTVARCERSVERVHEDAPSLERRLSACMSGGRFEGRDVTIGTHPALVEYHLLELPSAVVVKGNSETDQAVRWEVGALMGEAVEKVQARYWAVPPPSTPGPNTLAVGVREEVVRTTYDACANVGTVCRAIDVPAAALCRVGCTLRAVTDRSIWGILDLGYEQTRLVVCVEETPVLVRTVGVGGAQWTQRIADTLSISREAAEVHKREHGVARSGAAADPSSNGAARTELASILYGALRTDLLALAAETNRSFEYVSSCYVGREVRDLLLVGGGADLKGIDGLLNNRLGFPVRRISGLLGESGCRVSYSSGRGGSFEGLALAVGLAVPG